MAHVKGRTWYDRRRKQSDLAEDVEQDARVLDRLGARKCTATWEHYQEDGRPELLPRVTAMGKRTFPVLAAGRDRFS